MSNVSRSIETRPEREVLTHEHRRVKAIGMTKQKFAYAIVDASLNRMDREVLFNKIRVFLENFKESDGKPTVEDYIDVAKELSHVDAFSKEEKKLSVAEIPAHSKAKSKSASKDPVERALASTEGRKRAALKPNA